MSGAYFLFLGIPWLVYSHIANALDTSVPMQTSSWFLTSLLLSGLINALSAVPMSRFSSNKLFDYTDLKANGFTFGGTGLTCMCLYIAWWFSGDYPQSRRAAAGRAELLAKWQHTDRLQNPAKLRRFRIGGGIGAG